MSRYTAADDFDLMYDIAPGADLDDPDGDECGDCRGTGEGSHEGARCWACNGAGWVAYREDA